MRALAVTVFFSVLINELALERAQNSMYGVQLTPDDVQILIVLFADDVLLASYCVAGLQRQTDVLKHFADNFSMTFSMSKTKFTVFRKGDFLAASQGCFVNIFLERIMTDALEDHEGTVSIGCRTITILLFANDIGGLAGQKGELAKLVERLDKASTTYGMEISAKKTPQKNNKADDKQHRWH